MLVAQFQEKLTADTQRTEELFGDKVSQVTALLSDLSLLTSRIQQKAATLREKSKLTVSNLDLYRRNFSAQVPGSKLRIENMWNEAVREGNAPVVVFSVIFRDLGLLLR